MPAPLPTLRSMHVGPASKAPTLDDLTALGGWGAATAADSSSALDSSSKAAAKTKVKKQKQKAKVAQSSAVVKAGAKGTRTQRSGSQKGKPKQTATQSLQQRRPLPPHRAAIMVYAKAADGDVRMELRLHSESAAAHTDFVNPGRCCY